MTVVEFFDKDSIENVVSSLLCYPDKVVFIGDNSKEMDRAKAKYKKLVQSRGKNIEFISMSVTRNNLEDIVEKLNEIIDKFGDIEIDLTGGEDLYLVGAGIIFNAHPDKVKLHRFNINNSVLYDCDADGNVLNSTPEKLSVEENIAIYGGRVVYDTETSNGTHKWSFDKEFVSDVDIMWDICCSDPKMWNNVMKCIEFDEVSEERLSETSFKTPATTFHNVPEIVNELKKYGLIDNVEISNGYLAFDCKNAQIKDCLSKSGQLLEIKTASELLELNDLGNEIVDDILTGALIYWDNDDPTDKDVINEVDVIVMKGLVPVFVSCKNGAIDVNELYKLNTVATHFGGKYAKKVLVATNDADAIRSRADEMNIRVVDKLLTIDQDSKDFRKKIKSILN